MIQLVCRGPGSYTAGALDSLFTRSADVDRLIQRTEHEGLAGLLYRSIQKTDLLERLTHDQKKRLDRFYHHTLLHNLSLLGDLKSILQRLEGEGSPLVLLQGVSLLGEIYEDPGMRPMTDMDLWVLEQNFSEVMAAITELGYRQDPLYPGTFRKGTTTLDVHTHVFWADRIAARRMLLSSSQHPIYDRTRTVHVNGQQARCLDPQDQVLHLGLHALKHRMERLIWLVDIYRLVQGWGDTDWDALMIRANEFGQERAVLSVCYLLWALLDFRPPDPVLDSVKVNLGWKERKALLRRIRRDRLPIWYPLLIYSGKTSLRDRLVYLGEHAFPEPQVLRQVFPEHAERSPWQLHFMRLAQLLTKLKYW
jgi:hypothetical protein